MSRTGYQPETGTVTVQSAAGLKIAKREEREKRRGQQIPVDPAALVGQAEAEQPATGGVHEIPPDLAYRRLAMINVVFVGRPDAGDRGWVLIDPGIPATKALIRRAAAVRFGEGARPRSS